MPTLADLTVARRVAEELQRVLAATIEAYDVDYIWLRGPDGTPFGVLLTPEHFKRLRGDA